MFKPGEIAVVRQVAGVRQHYGTRVTVMSGPVPKSNCKWPILTDNGVYDETELFPAHPTVIATASGRDLSMEAFHARMADEKRNVLEEADGDLSLELRGAVEEALSEAVVDLNGHWKNGSDSEVLKCLFVGRRSMTRADAENLVRAVTTKEPTSRWVPVDVGLRMTLRTCPYCGEDDFATETNGLVIRLAGDRCEFADGVPLTEWELNVPSGKLVVTNDLCELFPLPEDEDSSSNTVKGRRSTTLDYAANGMAHAFVGNTCPGVYRVGDGSYKIANSPSDEEWDGEKFVKVTPAPVFEGERVAGICTDLWWYSICDHDEFKRRCERFKVDFNVEVVDVRPGVYRFRHDEETHRHEGSGERVFTRFEWVRESDPVQDFLARYEEIDVNPNAYVQAQVKRWPTLYGRAHDPRGVGKDKVVPWSDMTEEDRLSSWQRVADHIFCVIGGGTQWHERGFPKAKVDSTVLDVEPPAFRAQYHWYPFSKGYGGLFESRTLSPSFAKLAFRVLESIISFGPNGQGRGVCVRRRRCGRVPLARLRRKP